MSILSNIEPNITIGDIYEVLVVIIYDDKVCDKCLKGFDLQKYTNEYGQVSIKHHRYSIKMEIQDKVLALTDLGPGNQNIKKLMFEYLKDDVKETAKFARVGTISAFKEFRIFPYGTDEGPSLISICLMPKV